MTGFMFLAILVGAAFLVRDVQQSNMELLFGGHVYKESELQLAETAMSNAGLRNYERDGMRIRVPRNERDLYIKALADGKATPSQLGSATDRALSGSNMLESMFISKTRILEARQQDLSSALERLPFVDKVYVTYDEKREGFSSQMQSTAAVFVIPRNNRPLEEQQKRSIMYQVKAAFAGLKYENISVMDGSSGMSMNGESDPMNSEQQRYYHQKMQAEQRLKEKARNLLVDYGDVRVEANVELDTTIREETELVKYADKPVTVQTTVSKKDSESSRPVTGGRVGTDPNAIATANRSQSLASQNEQSSKSKEQQESERKIVGQETTLSERVGLAIKNASLSVSIPMSYYANAHRREWLELNPGVAVPKMEASDLKSRKEGTQKKIQTLLANLLPFSPGEDTRPQIVVDDYLDIPFEAIPGPSLAATAGGWLATNWQALTMFLMAGFVLMSIRTFVASGSKGSDDSAFDRGFDIPLDNASDIELASLSRSELTAAGGVDDGESGDGSTGSEAKEARARFKTTGGDMRSELASLIQENPDVAASLLRDWIGEAA
jgi:flagellar M-ring protein FliF